MLGLISVYLAEGRSRARHISQSLLELALLLFQEVRDLHGCLGSGQGSWTEVTVVDQVGFLEVLEGLVFVLHAQVETPKVVVDLSGLDVVGSKNSQTAYQ